MTKEKIDASRLENDIPFLPYIESLGIEISPDRSRATPDGGGVQCKCPFHLQNLGKIDNNFGSCYTEVKMKPDGNLSKRIHCWACGGSGNLREVTALMLNLDIKADYMKILTHMSNFMGGNLSENYGTGESYGYDAAILAGKLPPIKQEDLIKIGLNYPLPNDKKLHGCVVGMLSDKPEKTYIPPAGTYVLGLDNDKGVEWLLVKGVPISMMTLYIEDYETYIWLIISKCNEVIARYEELYASAKEEKSSESVNTMMFAKRKIFEIKKLLNEWEEEALKIAQ